MTTVYWAASLHDPFEQERNLREVEKLRNAGYHVYLPQEHGVWEDMVKQEADKYPHVPDEHIVRKVKENLYKEDIAAINNCNIVVAYVDRNPSEGTLWEMGYATALKIPVILINVNGWEFNLMPEYGSFVVSTTKEALEIMKDL